MSFVNGLLSNDEFKFELFFIKIQKCCSILSRNAGVCTVDNYIVRVSEYSLTSYLIHYFRDESFEMINYACTVLTSK